MMGERAVQVMNHKHMANRYIEVFLSNEGEMSQANVPPVGGASGQWPMEMGQGSNVCLHAPFARAFRALARAPAASGLRCCSGGSSSGGSSSGGGSSGGGSSSPGSASPPHCHCTCVLRGRPPCLLSLSPCLCSRSLLAARTRASTSRRARAS